MDDHVDKRVVSEVRVGLDSETRESARLLNGACAPPNARFRVARVHFFLPDMGLDDYNLKMQDKSRLSLAIALDRTCIVSVIVL